MSTPDSQELLKEEAKAIRTKLDTLIKDSDIQTRMTRSACIYAGMITETLMEYEEPDVVMEQAFHRIADLLRTDPAGDDDEGYDSLPPAYSIDHDTELGRHLARGIAKKLPRGMDDIHEIAIALIIDDFPSWEKQDFARADALKLLIETVIASLTYEMAAQDFCDLLIEEFITDNRHTTAEAVIALSSLAGYFFEQAKVYKPLPEEAEKEFTNVMIRESVRHGTPGPKDWNILAAANDTEAEKVPEYIKKLEPSIDEFFALIGLEDRLGQAVAIAKAVGRIVAVITVEDVGQMHPSIAKSLAKTGMILGARYLNEAKA